MLPKAFKISKNECIPPVNHLCTACISRPQNNVNYLLFMNILTICMSYQYIKKSPINTSQIEDLICLQGLTISYIILEILN